MHAATNTSIIFFIWIVDSKSSYLTATPSPFLVSKMSMPYVELDT